MATEPDRMERFDIGRVIGRGFETLGRQAVPFLVLCLVLLGLPQFLLQYLLFKDFATNPGGILALVTSPLYWLSLFGAMVSAFLLHGAIVRGTVRSLLGQPVAFGDLLLQALARLVPMIGLAILMFIICMIGFILLLVPGVILFIMFCVAVPVVMEERRGVFGSMARSRELTKGARWWIFLLLVIFFIVYGIVANAVTMSTFGFLTTMPAVYVLAGTIVASAFGVLWAVMFASLYVELRLIKEGAGGQGALADVFA